MEEISKNGIGASNALEIFGDRGGPAFEVLKSGVKNLKELNDLLENTNINV